MSGNSCVFVMGVFGQGSNLLIKKLKRLIYCYIQRSFNKIKNHKKQIINLDLINSFQKRLLAIGLFSIKIFTEINKRNKIEEIIIKNKKSNLIFNCLGRLEKKIKK